MDSQNDVSVRETSVAKDKTVFILCNLASGDFRIQKWCENQQVMYVFVRGGILNIPW